MQVKSIAECSKGSILQHLIRPPLSYQLLLHVRSLFSLFLIGRFTHVLLYTATSNAARGLNNGLNFRVPLFFVYACIFIEGLTWVLMFY